MTARKKWQNLLEGRAPWAICVNFNWRRFFLKKTEMEWDKTMGGGRREATYIFSFWISKRRGGGQDILNMNMINNTTNRE